jgi:hypothetical protein
MKTLYKIVRFYKDRPANQGEVIIKEGLTLEEAQAHCNDPTTEGDDWFDGYREMLTHPKAPNYRSLTEACRLLLTKGDIGHRVKIYSEEG